MLIFLQELVLQLFLWLLQLIDGIMQIFSAISGVMTVTYHGEQVNLIELVVLAYGAVFSVNVFVLILPLLSQMQIDGIGGFGNSLFLIFMIIGGAMVIPAGMGLFARLFGQGDDAHGGGSFLRSAYYGSRFAGLATLGVVGGLVKGSVRAGKRIANRVRSKKSDDGGSDGGSGADGGDRYTETPAAAESETDTGGNGESG